MSGTNPECSHEGTIVHLRSLKSTQTGDDDKAPRFIDSKSEPV